jgi:hypothetical protein
MAITSAGRDFQSRVMADTASTGTGAYASATWIGLTADTNAPSLSTTALPGELTGGSMGRGQGAFGHTVGTSSWTLTRTVTVDRSVRVAKLGIYNAAAGPTLVFETLLDFAADVKAGDTLQVVFTGTM